VILVVIASRPYARDANRCLKKRIRVDPDAFVRGTNKARAGMAAKLRIDRDNDELA
jgi:hypothetical protein